MERKPRGQCARLTISRVPGACDVLCDKPEVKEAPEHKAQQKNQSPSLVRSGFATWNRTSRPGRTLARLLNSKDKRSVGRRRGLNQRFILQGGPKDGGRAQQTTTKWFCWDNKTFGSLSASFPSTRRRLIFSYLLPMWQMKGFEIRNAMVGVQITTIYST